MNLSSKVLSRIIMTSVLLMGISSLYSYFTQKSDFIKMYQEEHVTLVTNSLDTLMSAISDYDNEAIEAAIDGLFNSDSVYKVQLIGKEGSLILGKKRQIDSPQLSSEKLEKIDDDLIFANFSTVSQMKTILNKDRVRIVAPIFKLKENKKEIISFIFLDYTLTVPLKMAWTSLKRYIATGGVLILVLTFVLNLFIKNSVVNPVLMLGEAGAKMARGDFTASANIKSNDELGILYSNFLNMRDQVKMYTENLQGLVDEKTKTVVMQKKKVQNILNNLEQGILTFGKSMEIDDEFSSYVSKLYRRSSENIKGKNVINTIFPKVDLSTNDFSEFTCVFASILGENELAYELNNGHLIKKAIVEIENSKHDLEFDWVPLLDSHNNVEKLLLSIRDMTKQNELELKFKIKNQEAEQQTIRITELVSCDKNFLLTTFKDGKARLDKIKNLLHRQENPNETFIHLHTLKGNFRTLGIKRIVELIHTLEGHVQIWRDEGRLESNEVIALYNDLEGLFFKYEKDFHHIYQDQMSDNVQNTSNLFALTASFAKNLYDQTIEQKLSYGGISVTDNIDCWSSKFLNDFKEVFPHFLGNTIDHGYALPMSKGEVVTAVQIAITANYIANNEVLICLKNFGVSIDTDLIKKTARKLNIDSSIENIEDLLFYNGFSTSTKITNTSGRGVGLSAIKQFAQQKGGRVRIRTQDVTGFTLEIFMPTEIVTESSKKIAA